MFTKKQLKQLKKSFCGDNYEFEKFIFYHRRRQGNTLGHCFWLISRAQKKPNTPIPITDYIPGYNFSDLPDQNLLIKTIVIPQLNDIISKMGLMYYKINKTKKTLTYDLSFLDDFK